VHVVHAAPGYPPAPGGIETYVGGLCRGLAAHGTHVEVLTAQPGAASEQGRSLRVRRFPSLTLPGLRGYPILPRLPAALLRTRADVVHGHGLHTFCADAPAVTSRLRSLPFVLNPYFAPATTPKWRAYQRTLGRLTARADLTVVISRFEQRALAAAGLLFGRVELVPPAIRAAEFRGPRSEALLARYGLDARQHRIVLALGRISRAKGAHLLIKAAALLARKMPEMRVLVVGPDWGERAAAEERARAAGLAGRVIFTGALSRADVRRALRSAHVLAHPSRFEAFGLVLLEAMAAGLPVVALRTSAIPEVVDDGRTGLLAQPDDPGEFAACLAAVLEDEALAHRLAAAGAEHVATQASERAQGARMLELYGSLVSD
jgi:glycosyltransferase involved in cell wall biosynthesis